MFVGGVYILKVSFFANKGFVTGHKIKDTIIFVVKSLLTQISLYLN